MYFCYWLSLISQNGSYCQSLLYFNVLFFSYSAVCLQDSVLAFHKHGMQGRSFKANEVSTIFALP